MHWKVIVLLPLVTACSASAGPPEWRTRGAPRSVAPSTPPSIRYNDPVTDPAPTDPVADAVLEVIARVAPQLTLDPRLSRACAALAATGHDGGPPSMEAVEFAVTHEGIVEPSPHILIIDGDERGAGPATAAELEKRLPAALAQGQFVRAGAGSAPGPGGTRRVIVAFQESFVDVEPVARELALGRTVALRGKLKPPYRDPVVFLTLPSGRVENVPVARAGDAGFRAEVHCKTRGILRIEVTARSEGGGPSVLANFPVYCDQRAPTELAVSRRPPAPIGSIAETERRLFELANEERVRHGLTPFVWDDRAASIARGHSDEMARDGYVAHQSPKTGSAADRAQKGGLGSPLILENLARAFTSDEAHLGLMNSPGHRANILSSEATHLGVGVAIAELDGRRTLYATQLFFRIGPKIDRDVARLEVLTLVRAKRRDAGKGGITPDTALDEIAQGYADAAAIGRREDGVAWARRKIQDLGGRYEKVSTLYSVAGSVDQAITDAVIDGADRIGIGVAQGPNARFGEAAIYLVIMLGARR